jgi:outer membrane protein assembly factor BamB
MKFDKTKTASITLILMLTFSATILAFPIVSAHDPPINIPSYAYVTATPNPIGVGQSVLIVMWLDFNPPTASGAYGDRWDGYMIEITKPDGTKDNLGPFTSDPVGNMYTSYTPTQTGTYTIRFTFPGDTITGEPVPPTPTGQEFIGDYMEPSSDETILTVQQDPIEPYPITPLPDRNTYWERPIYGEYREWWSISGNWLGTGDIKNSYQPYSRAPKTSHILWTRPITFGGIAGGSHGNIPYYDGLSYERRFHHPVIIQGRLYYNEYPQKRYAVDNPPPGIYCVDLRTGEELWYNNASLTYGQVYDYESPNAHGTLAYLWFASPTGFEGIPGTQWIMYDAFNGIRLATIQNMTGGTMATSNDGSILLYNLNTREDTLTLWNSSRCVWYRYGDIFQANYYWNWRPPYGGPPLDAANGISWEVSIPSDLTGSINAVFEDKLIGSYGLHSFLTPGTDDPWGLWAISLKPENRGQLLWKKEYSAPSGNKTMILESVDPETGVIIMSVEETMELYGYDGNNGNQIWGPTDPQPAWDFYGINTAIAYGKVFSCGIAGILYCRDIKTGELLWTYESESSGFESPYGEGKYPFSIGVIADSVIYIYSSEHSPTKPFWRGSKLRCVDVNTGDEVWTLPVWAGNTIIADGYLVTLNSYDNQLYCFGKGETATTVTSTNVGVPLGSSVMITGTVTDQSPGAKDTPAIADEYMSDWMEYLYLQEPCPATFTGVEVKLETLDPNNNFYEIGTVTSDASGMFKLMWEPPVPGEYTIIATFEGSEAYFSSYAETAIGVTEAPSPGQPIEPEPTEPTEAFALGNIELAIIAVVIIAAVAIIAFWALRKRK